jgi:hypothetical protein
MILEKSAFKQRFIIGLLGILLPIMTLGACLLFGEHKIPRSISASYYTNARTILEVSLGILGIIFLTYSSTNQFYEWIHKLMGISVLGIAVFPTSIETYDGPIGIFNLNPHISSIFHQLFTGIFFVLIAFTMLFLLPNCFERKFKFPRKKDKYYFISGILEGTFLIALMIGIILDLNQYFQFTYLLEILLMWNFGIAWMINSWDIYNHDRLIRNRHTRGKKSIIKDESN